MKYEDIYKTIYDIDLEGKFSQNITVLSDTVSKKYANITGVLVKFYCKQVSSDRVQVKRKRKNVEHDEIEKIKQDLQAKKLEKIALEDDYFVSKKLYPNVDFYSGIILKAMGIPEEMFTVIFATGRTVGWISHWNEMITHPYRIARPRQLYTGADVRDYTPIDER